MTASVDEVVIVADGQEIARHRRSYEAGDLVFNPLHYLALLEQKVGALDQAAPLQGWDLPTEFATLRRLLEARLSPKNRCAAGKREYVQVLRLIETIPLAMVHGGSVKLTKPSRILGLRCQPAKATAFCSNPGQNLEI